jgi:DNA polymerase elongation subunit (family B)
MKLKLTLNNVFSDPNRFKYEHIFEFNNDAFIRVFDSEQNESYLFNAGKKSFIPDLYLKTSKETEYRSFNDGTFLYKNEFSNLFDMKKFLKENKAFNNPVFGNVNRPQKIIRDVWSNPIEANHKFHTIWLDIETESGDIFNKEDKVKFKKHKDDEATYDISIGNLQTNSKAHTGYVFDEELNKYVPVLKSCYLRKPGFPHAKDAMYKITVIQTYDTKLKQYIIFGLQDWDNNYKSKWGEVKYYKMKDEKQMLESFIKLIQTRNPTALNSFNGEVFDYPYLINRMEKLGIDYTKLSPIGIVERGILKNNQQGFEYEGVSIKGLFLFDIMDFVIKYAFLKISSFSLNNVAKAFGLNPKVDTSSYTSFQGFQDGKGYIFPNEIPEDENEAKIYNIQLKYKNGKCSKEEFNKVIFNNFMNYAIRDVEVMLEVEEISKVTETAKLIAYITGVNVTDVSGSLKQWASYIYNDAIRDGVVLCTEQQNVDNNVIYKAGWTSSQPGKIHEWVVSFDFASLYPNLIQTFNIGADTLVSHDKLPEDLRKHIETHCNFYSQANFGEDGLLITKYGSDTNDLVEETKYFDKLYNDEELTKLLVKYNLTMTPNGVCYKRNKTSYMSKAMRENIQRRYKAKHSGIAEAGKLEKIKAELNKRGINYE